jgi:hypothetical protein
MLRRGAISLANTLDKVSIAGLCRCRSSPLDAAVNVLTDMVLVCVSSHRSLADFSRCRKKNQNRDQTEIHNWHCKQQQQQQLVKKARREVDADRIHHRAALVGRLRAHSLPARDSSGDEMIEKKPAAISSHVQFG